MKILVTGAHGQLATALVALKSHHEMTALPRADLDITSQESVRKSLTSAKPDVVINAAAYNFVDQAETDQEQAFRVNETGPFSLAVETARIDIPLLHVSTDYVFDGRKNKPYLENDQPNPLSVYGRSKRAGEEAVIKNNPKHYVVRTAWLYSVTGKNFPKTMLALAGKSNIQVISDQQGSPTYVPHLAAGLLKILEQKKEFGIYHMAGSGAASWFEFAKTLYAEAGVKTPLQPIMARDYKLPRPAERPFYSVLGTRHADLLLPPWKEGVQEFAKKYI